MSGERMGACMYVCIIIIKQAYLRPGLHIPTIFSINHDDLPIVIPDSLLNIVSAQSQQWYNNFTILTKFPTLFIHMLGLQFYMSSDNSVPKCVPITC